MAEQRADATHEEQKPQRKLPIKTIILILLVILLEGGTIIGVKMLSGGPKPSEATDPIEQTEEQQNRNLVEVVIVDQMSVDNWVLGRARIVVTLNVSATTNEDKAEKLTAAITENKTQIKDRIRTLVGDAQPEDIRDPHLQVIKREIKATVEEIVGEGLIDEILMPDWTSYVID